MYYNKISEIKAHFVLPNIFWKLSKLNLVERRNINTLNLKTKLLKENLKNTGKSVKYIIFVGFDLLLKQVDRDELVFHDTGNLELVYSES